MSFLTVMAANSRRSAILIGLVALLGALTVFRADALPPTIDLDSTSADLTVYGDDAGDLMAHVTAGDINGDGTDDLIMGAPHADPAGRTDAGAAYVIYGGPGLPATIDLDSTSADLTVLGDDAGDSAGVGAAGDINGDGTDDLIISAGYADGPGSGTGCGPGQVGDRCQAGEVYVIYGGPSLTATIDLDSTSADLTIYGDATGLAFGWSPAVGDINGDDTDDLIIGAPYADNMTGAAYVIYGGPSLPATIDLNSTSADLTVYGDDVGDELGNSLAAEDINGDGTDDLIIGAWQDHQYATRAGKTHVIYGGPSLPATIDLNSTSADLTVLGDDVGDRLGKVVKAADINGDGTDDLIISAAWADPVGGSQAGETYVIYGGPSLPATIDLNSTSAGLTVYGDDAGDSSGYLVATGDINGDTTDDLIIGAHPASPAGRSAAGETYVIYGGPGLPAAIDLDSTSAGLTVYGDDAGDWSSAGAAGDINGDGTDDLIIGAYKADGSGTGTSCGSGQVGDRCGAGEAYVIYGDPPPPTPTATTTATPPITPTPTPGPVGGIALDSDLRSLPLETTDAGTLPWGVAVGIIAAASLIAVGGAGWYARRRVNARKQF